MKRLLYISTLPKNSQSGGANAVNFHTFKALNNYFDCHYKQINPPEPKLGKRLSQIKRKLLKVPAAFNYFSKERLIQIASEFNSIVGNYDVVFFRDFAPWVMCEPKVPYVAYNDVHFLQFFKNTFSSKEFSQGDIQRICNQEKVWLSQAKALAFESSWGAKQCAKDYQIKNSDLVSVGRGGHIPIPERDTYAGRLNLVIIANNFYQKGGDLVFEAFKSLKSYYPKLELHIVGGHPGRAVEKFHGVRYHGYIYKEVPVDLKKLTDILSQAFLLMHVTREDTNPLVITEAGYYGCPSISVDKFAIPELVLHKKTGIIIPCPVQIDDIIESVANLINSREDYKKMRKATIEYNQLNFTWESIGKQLKHLISH